MRKILSLLLVMAMCTSLVIGCGKKEETTDQVTSTDEAATTDTVAETDTDAAAEEPVAEELIGKYDPAITITYNRNGAPDPKFPEGTDYEHNIWISEYESELGIIAQQGWATTSEEDYTTKLNLAIASGELPDLIQTVSTGQIQQLVDSDLVQDLTEVFEKYASPLTKEILNLDGGLFLSQLTFNGKIMALPSFVSELENQEYLYMRDDWRVNLGLEKPQNMEDLIELARAFTFNDPDGNGADDTYGFAFSNQPFENYWELKGFFNSYGAYPDIFIKKDGKIVYGGVQPEMKTALATLRDLYAEGVIDPDFVVKDSYAASSEAVNGKTGLNYGKFWVITWPLPDGENLNPASDWTPYPLQFDANAPIKGSMYTSSIRQAYMVNKDCKNPEALIKMYNHYIEKTFGETADQKKYHIDGEYNIHTWAVVTGGGSSNMDQNVIATKALDDNDTSIIKTPEQLETYNMLKEFVEGNTDSAHWQKAKLFYGPDSVFGIANYYRDNNLLVRDEWYGADTPTMLERMSILDDSEKEMILKIIIGEESLEYFDEFVTNWYELGGEAILTEVNEWYNTK